MFERYIVYTNATANVLNDLGHIRYCAQDRNIPKEVRKRYQDEVEAVEAALAALPEFDRNVLDIFYLSMPESVTQAMYNGKEQLHLEETALRRHKKKALEKMAKLLFPR